MASFNDDDGWETASGAFEAKVRAEICVAPYIKPAPAPLPKKAAPVPLLTKKAESSPQLSLVKKVVSDVKPVGPLPLLPKAVLESSELSVGLRRGLARRGFDKYTQVQSQAMAELCAGRDIIVAAPAGTGKTGAYAIYALDIIDLELGVQVIIMVPTQVLSEQVANCVREFAIAQPGIRIFNAAGGKGCEQLGATAPHVIVSTPGRLCAFLGQMKNEDGTPTSKRIDESQVKFVALDEADALLDVQMKDQVASIFRVLPPTAQTGYYSATIGRVVQTIVENELVNLEKYSIIDLATGAGVGGADRSLRHHFWVSGSANWEDRTACLIELLKTFVSKVMVFARKQEIVDFIQRALQSDPVLKKRIATSLPAFIANPNSILITTDVCSRGLDISDVRCVINFDLPPSAVAYTQRAGRTGRGGTAGTIISMIGEADQFAWVLGKLDFNVDLLPDDCVGLPGACSYGSIPVSAPVIVKEITETREVVADEVSIQVSPMIAPTSDIKSIQDQIVKIQFELDAQEVAFQAKLDAQRVVFQAKLDAQEVAFQAKLDAQEVAFQAKLDAQEATLIALCATCRDKCDATVVPQSAIVAISAVSEPEIDDAVIGVIIDVSDDDAPVCDIVFGTEVVDEPLTSINKPCPPSYGRGLRGPCRGKGCPYLHKSDAGYIEALTAIANSTPVSK
jgi:superfamily II DNA/RNA helicase